MLFDNWFEVALLFWGAFELGKWYANYHTKRNMKELLDDLGVPYDERQKLQDKTRSMLRGPTRIILTKNNGIFYAHDANTERFLGQDKDREELFKYLARTIGEGTYEVLDKTQS